MVELSQQKGVLRWSGAPLDDELLKVRKELESAIKARAGSNLVIDLSDMTAVSSRVLSLLLCALRHAQSHGCTLKFSGISQGLYDMARVGGIESLLPLQRED